MNEKIFSSIFCQYNQLGYSYYGIEINAKELFGKGATKNCGNFISEHFERGKKGSAIILPFEEAYKKDTFRHIHMVSLYLLGLSLRDLFAEHLETIEHNTITDFYTYIWFLTCLYHDSASCLETSAENSDALNAALFGIQVKYTIYEHTMQNGEPFSATYSEKLIHDYYTYIQKEWKHLDHGIIGGYLLFDKLIALFEKEIAGYAKDCSGTYKVTPTGLKWTDEMPDIFATVADAIISHNIWLCPANDKKTKRIYKQYHLEPLIIASDENKLSLEKSPLTFLLCLLDTIEPVKRFWKQGEPIRDIKKILKLISITKESGHLKIAWYAEAMRYPGFYDWMKAIIGLQDWMKVTVSQCIAGNCKPCTSDELPKHGGIFYLTIRFDLPLQGV